MPRRRGGPLRPPETARPERVPPTAGEVAEMATSAGQMARRTLGWAEEAAGDGDTELAAALRALAEQAQAFTGDATTLSRLMIRFGYPATR